MSESPEPAEAELVEEKVPEELGANSNQYLAEVPLQSTWPFKVAEEE
jgi:hypothetical protein